MVAVLWGARSGTAPLPALISKTCTVLFLHYAAPAQPFIPPLTGSLFSSEPSEFKQEVNRYI